LHIIKPTDILIGDFQSKVFLCAVQLTTDCPENYVTTAEAIESITDAGLFEILAIRVLKNLVPEFKFIDHMGVNAEGKTIRNPVDSFCRVPDTNPPRFVMAAFTIGKLDSLEHKWLHDHENSPKTKKSKAADDGDLVKAGRSMLSLRATFPNAIFVVYLCTNRQPNDALLSKVIVTANNLDLEVRFLTRSHIRDHLDTDRDGQWLRKEHLGIQADRLSLHLLRELSFKSLKDYGDEFLLTEPTAFVKTASELSVTDALSTGRSINIVTGVSGTGKSVTCYQALCNHLNAGGIGLWIPGEIAASTVSLVTAIDERLRTLHPTIETSSGSEAVALANGSQSLLLVIDDINRGGRPADTIRKVLAWHSTSSSGEDLNTATVSILMPVWDVYWASHDSQLRSAKWLTKTTIGPMRVEEACACLVAAIGNRLPSLGIAEQTNIVENLGRDPILIALYAQSLQDNSHLIPPALAFNVVENFVNSVLEEAVVASKSIQADFDSALMNLAKYMLESRDLYPRWVDIRELLPNYEVDALNDLVRLGKLCRISARTNEHRFEFRHDRILEYYCARSIRNLLANVVASKQVLTEPFYAEFIGRALSITEISEDVITWIEQHAPVALIASIRYLSNLSSGNSLVIIDTTRRWLTAVWNDPETPRSLVFETRRLLERTDSPAILEITNDIPNSVLLGRARLANGSADSIIIEFANFTSFAPAVNDVELESIIDRALQRHKNTLTQQCSEILLDSTSSETELVGILVLCGFLGIPTLAKNIRVAWDRLQDSQKAILPTLWAGFRCGEGDPEHTLGPVLVAWSKLSDIDSNGILSDRLGVAHQLQFAVRHKIPASVLNYLIQIARTNKSLHWPMLVSLKQLDDPIAITFLLEECSVLKKNIKDRGGFSPWLISTGDQWDSTKTGRGRQLSPLSLRAMRSCWESTQDVDLQETAFRAWAKSSTDLEDLREIPEDFPLYTIALKRRIRLRDHSTTYKVLHLLSTDSSWFQYLHYVWSPLFQSLLDRALDKLAENTSRDYSNGRSDEHYLFANLIRDIPVVDAEPLILKHWGGLQFSSLFVQAALYLGTQECRARVAEAITAYPESVCPFKNLSAFFGFYTLNMRDRISQQHLDTLLPYLNKIDECTLSSMAKHCQQYDMQTWAVRHLKPEFERRAKQLSINVVSPAKNQMQTCPYFPSDSNLLDVLNKIEERHQDHQGSIYHWSKRFDERHDPHDRWYHILDTWLGAKPSERRFRIVASAVLYHGTRSDLSLLSKYLIEADMAVIERIRSNAVFGVMRRTLSDPELPS
jgi:hypothetical protein